jgi:hypothetical protein
VGFVEPADCRALGAGLRKQSEEEVKQSEEEVKQSEEEVAAAENSLAIQNLGTYWNMWQKQTMIFSSCLKNNYLS